MIMDAFNEIAKAPAVLGHKRIPFDAAFKLKAI